MIHYVYFFVNWCPVEQFYGRVAEESCSSPQPHKRTHQRQDHKNITAQQQLKQSPNAREKQPAQSCEQEPAPHSFGKKNATLLEDHVSP